jgi:hypothetical protein
MNSSMFVCFFLLIPNPFKKTSGGCYVGAVGSVSQTLVDLIIARARATPDSCNSMVHIESSFIGPFVSPFTSSHSRPVSRLGRG